MLRINLQYCVYVFLLCVHFSVCFSYLENVFDITKQMWKQGLIDREEKDPLLYTELVDGYRVYQKKLSWNDAMDFCSKCGMSFATFKNKEEAEKVRDSIYDLSVYSGKPYDGSEEQHEFMLERRYWFGLKEDEAKIKTYYWMKSKNEEDKEEANITNYGNLWWKNEPDRKTADGVPEYCIGFWNPNYYIDTNKPGTGSEIAKHSFNDFPCDRKYYYICKVEDADNVAEKAENDECKSSLRFEKDTEILD